MRHAQPVCVAVALFGAYCGCGGGGTSNPCGNGILDNGESCDDGNSNSGDGCSSKCTIETGWTCDTPTGGKSTCTPICGDGIVVGSEVCDDGNTATGDGCSASCLVEAGWQCTGEPSACTPLPTRVRTPPVFGAPIAGLPDRTWSYVEFPDSTCGDGSPAALFISPGSDDLLFVLGGGRSTCSNRGDCLSALASGVLNLDHAGGSSPWDAVGPSGVAWWNSTSNTEGSIFARGDLDNPVA